MDNKEYDKSNVGAQLNGNDEPPPSYDQSLGPQIALNTDFITTQPMSFRMKGHTFSSDLTISDAKGHPVFEVHGSSFSASHNTLFVDAKSNSQLFEINKKILSMSWRYSALLPGGNGQPLFETETAPTFFSGGTTVMTFRNALTSQMETLELQLHNFSTNNEVMYRGNKIADINHEPFSMTASYAIDIHVPGVDPLLLAVLAVVMHDRRRSRRNNNH